MIAKLLMAVTMALTALGTPGTDVTTVQAGDHYLSFDSGGFLTLWAESNGKPGLQPDPVIILGVVVVEADRPLHV